MSNVAFRGVDVQKKDPRLGLEKDNRKWSQKFASFIYMLLPGVFAAFAILISYFLPELNEITLLLALFSVYIWKYTRRHYLNNNAGLMDKPKYKDYPKKAIPYDFAPKEDPADYAKMVKAKRPYTIGAEKHFKALSKLDDAVYFFGTEVNTKKEMHASDSKTRTHIVLMGTTGAGKTETILSLCANFLAQASSFILTDGKGDQLLFAKVFSLVRAFDRVDDLYMLNFLDPGDLKKDKRVERVTNTFNFFVDSTDAEANAIVGGLLPTDEGGGSGMWESRAATGIESLNKALYWLAENGYMQLDPDTYREYFMLDKFSELAMDARIPPEYRAGLWTLLTSINYKAPSKEDKNPKQPSTTEEQWQFITMQFTSTFNMLATEYSHITVSQCPDIVMTDIVLRRRILLILLPTLSKSSTQVRNLGKIIIAMTRNVSSKALGTSIEGTKLGVVDSKPTNAVSSYAFMFDEWGAYAGKGAETLPQQVRSLNIVCVFAGQNFGSFEAEGLTESASTIWSNCTIKACMKIEDDATAEKFSKMADEEFTLVADSYEMSDNGLSRKYKEAKTARVEKRPVLNIKDLKGQGAGMITFLYGASVERLRGFYADPTLCDLMRINHFVEILPPSRTHVDLMRQNVDELHVCFRAAMEGKAEVMVSLALEMHAQSPDELTTFSGVNDNVEKAATSSGIQLTPFERIMTSTSVHMINIEAIDEKVKRAVEMLTQEDFSYEDVVKESIKTDHEIRYIDDYVEQSEENWKAQTRVLTQDKLLMNMKQVLREKQTLQNELERASFASLKAVSMDVFRLETQLASLEQVILESNLKEEDMQDIAQIQELADTSAKITVSDMGIKSNIASVVKAKAGLIKV